MSKEISDSKSLEKDDPLQVPPTVDLAEHASKQGSEESPNLLSDDELDLDECAREPIHRLGFIQPHGALLAYNRSTSRVEFASENLGRLLGLDPHECLGKKLVEALPSVLIEQLYELLDVSLFISCTNSESNRAASSTTEIHAAAKVGRTLLKSLRGDQEIAVDPVMASRQIVISERRDVVDVFAFNSGTHRVLEFIFLQQYNDTARIDLMALLDDFVDSSNGVLNIYRIARSLVDVVRRAVGFDRVLLYRFEDDWSGEVIAEDRSPEVSSYIGLRFPASDIPQQARALYERNPFRGIGDVYAPNVPILSASSGDRSSSAGSDLDLSFSMLRSVSPVHIEYLKNMGVVSSVSVSVLVDGKLWGLISLHNLSPRMISWHERLFLVELARRFEARLAAARISEQTQIELKVASIIERIREGLTESGRILSLLVESQLRVPQLFECDGFAVVADREVIAFGEAPAPDSVLQIIEQMKGEGRIEFLGERKKGVAAATSMVDLLVGTTESVAGALVGFVSVAPLVAIVVFRREMVSEVHWGGNPNKAAQFCSSKGRLEPRRSFELWKEVHKGRCKPWENQDFLIMVGLLEALDVAVAPSKQGAVAEFQEEFRQFLNVLASSGALRDLLSEYVSRDPVVCICNRRSKSADNSNVVSVIPSATFCHMFRIDGYELEQEPDKTLRQIGVPTEILTDSAGWTAIEVWSPGYGNMSLEVKRIGLLQVVTSGESLAIAGLRFQDKTREHGLETALSSIHDEAELARVTRFNILSNMSHELRTPLNVMLGFAQILAMEKDGPLGSPSYRKYLGEILRAGKHLTDLIDQALDFAKVESGHYALIEDEIDIREPLRDAFTWINEMADAKGVKFDLVLPQQECKFRGEAKAIRQIALNLLHNAVKFTPPQGVISLTLSRLKPGGFAVNVTDSGVGIDPALLPYIFRPFVQADRSRARRIKGTGIGLSVVKALVELHGGTISVESTEGHGSTFTVIFPSWRSTERLSLSPR